MLFSLKNVSFQNIVQYPDIEISSGKITFICGGSGVGKSTLFKLLNGVVSPSSGEIEYLNKSLEAYDFINLRREVLLVSQNVYLFDDRSIRDNFKEFYQFRDLKALSDGEMTWYLNLCAIEMPLDTMAYQVIILGGNK